jgi:sec-independent protein translocase protein TatA
LIPPKYLPAEQDRSFTMLAYAPGLPELVIFGFIVLLLFGKRLPDVMRSMGKSIVEFKKGANEAEAGDNGQDDQTT